jgi:Holliday junction resolvase
LDFTVGKPSRDKGARFEREIVAIAQAHDLDAKRVPLSGATNFHKGDVVVSNDVDSWTVEAKKRANGFKTIYGWLEKGDCDLLVLGADRKAALAVLPLADFFDLLAGKHT